jgi:hypothetical protein
MNRNFKILNILLLVFLFSSCSSLVEDLNEDPNNPGDAPVELMVTGMQLGNVLVHEGELARMAGMWSGYFTGSDRQYITLQTYNATAGDFDNIWGTLYAETVAQARIIQGKADATNNPELKGIAQIIEAHAIGTATALWGDVPFSEAANVETFPEPSYDAQAGVYAALQLLLDDGIANVGASSNTQSDATTLGGGNWAEVANTLKARYYLHVGNYEAAIAAANNGISAAGNDWMASHAGGFADGRMNTYFNFSYWNREGYMTADNAPLTTMMDSSDANVNYRGDAKTDETARFNYYFQNWTPGASHDHNFWVGGMYYFDEAFPLVTYSENQLIIAESSLRQGTADEGIALNMLNSHRAALDARWGAADGATYGAYSAADFETGGIANANGAARADAMLAEIHEEKYVSMYGQIEGFTDLRRTNNAVGISPNTGTAIPERFVYPQAEVNSNSKTPSPLPGIFDATPVNQ